jgi:hypothetical protein
MIFLQSSWTGLFPSMKGGAGGSSDTSKRAVVDGPLALWPDLLLAAGTGRPLGIHSVLTRMPDPMEFRDRLLAIVAHHRVARVISIQGQVLIATLGDPDADRDCDGNADYDSRNAT